MKRNRALNLQFLLLTVRYPCHAHQRVVDGYKLFCRVFHEPVRGEKRSACVAEPVSTNAATLVTGQSVFDELAHRNYRCAIMAFGSIVHVNGYAA